MNESGANNEWNGGTIRAIGVAQQKGRGIAPSAFWRGARAQ